MTDYGGNFGQNDPFLIKELGSKVQRFKGSEVQRFRGSKVQRFKGSEVQRFKDNPERRTQNAEP